ncbi:sigma-B regulation protein RsbU (phosphoserine phosphatase) [Desulfocicer vacuolatum DSM 3385]|uniref:Sigma-B regulation protein RsbU (Phosphoserine phosphatase) n=1 Tax=Desulfocicer vacuolatum DSM 3385 TaxID=1121400 RepID=A0A1W1YNT1_9BACT|nr:fused response regulator/phosphatase [Desulfocicer vacuolatum]SMC37793.1 sigma-B regulation protein RsbU (phosphoserine phosphatase) [Desulfocicer vacuolatum DSM 3385]
MFTTHPMTILAIDDHPLNLKIIEKALSKEGYRVLCADNGPEGRKLAVEQHPSLILLDITMPGETGFDVIRALKKNFITTAIPVIFLTASHSVKSKLKGFQLGAVDYITKPFHPQEVIARIQLHLKLSIASNSLITAQAGRLRQITQAQASLLPTPEAHPDATFGVFYKTMEEAGGDFYDIIDVAKDIKGYFVADFSGHGIETSYMTYSLKALLTQNFIPVYKPVESMKIINDVLVELLPEEKYLTACYLLINRITGIATIINAGHLPVILLPVSGAPHLVKTDGDILGMFTDATFGMMQFKVHPGDRLFMYTDGLVESVKNKITWCRGADTLLPMFKKAPPLPIKEMSRRLVQTIFNNSGPPEDDILLLSIEV